MLSRLATTLYPLLSGARWLMRGIFYCTISSRDAQTWAPASVGHNTFTVGSKCLRALPSQVTGRRDAVPLGKRRGSGPAPASAFRSLGHLGPIKFILNMASCTFKILSSEFQSMDFKLLKRESQYKSTWLKNKVSGVCICVAV